VSDKVYLVANLDKLKFVEHQIAADETLRTCPQAGIVKGDN
jgi:hypothetical protein